MRIACSHCGERGHEEFAYLGDATVLRPEFHAVPQADGDGGAADRGAEWQDYVYLRDNPSGAHRELWQHVGGCRAWLVVTRDTRSHAILDVEPAHDVAVSRDRQS
ncbi:MAG: sarcosine oxidase subunit delta [Hyphomicrobiaceae bacterium]